MAIGSLPPVTNEIQANSGQPGKTLAQQTAASSLLDLQAAVAAEPTTAIVPETTLLERAVAEALGRQGGLASLYATLTELAKAPDLPDSVKAAVNTLLAFRLDESDVTPERVAQAIRSSGVFHEAVASGNMAAALPPAVRQALGGAPADNVQMATRPVISSPAPATTSPATRPPSSPQPQSSDNFGAPASGGVPAAAAQAYGRLGGLSTPALPSSVPEAPTTAAVVTPDATSPANTPEAAAAPSGNRPAPAGGALTQVADTSALLPQSGDALVQPGSVGEGAVAASPASPSPSERGLPTGPDAVRNAPVSNQPQVLPVESNETLPTLPTAKDVTSKASYSVVPEMPAAVPEQVTAPGTAIPAPTGARPLPSATPAQSTAIPAGEAPSQHALPASPSSEAPNARSFAPWTPGRPLTVASQAPADNTGVSAEQTAMAVSSPTTAPPAAEPGLSRPAGDRAPFVPSAVENLPNAQPGTVASKTPAGPAPAIQPQAAATPGPVQPSEHALGTVSSQASNPFQSTPSATQASAEPAPFVAPPVRVATTPPSTAPEITARLAAPQAASPTMPPPAELGLDLKGALDLLRRELVTWLGRNADVMASLDGASDDGTAPRVDRPQPPRKGGPVRGQPAVALPGGEEADSTSTEMLAGRALGEAERSLSRVFLHQAATADGRDSKVAQVAQTFVMEIPIAGPNGTSVAQLRIERDDHAPSEPGSPPRRVFQVDIAFDIAPLGPVAVRVGLMDGRRVAVGVWCESDDGLVRMEAERENIVLGLEQEGMVVAGVDLHRGHPPEGHEDATAIPSHRLDLQL